MYLDSWSIALALINILGLFLILTATSTAVRVLRFWDPDSDAKLQIDLENETWLASTLVQYGLWFQIAALVLLVAAADSFSNVLAGAMCATGSLLANNYGFPLLWLKIAGVFFYGFWILLHRLDIQVETYPLVKVKFAYLLLLLPLLIADSVLEVLYLGKLNPDIITSCCAVVFASGDGGRTLLDRTPVMITPLFYGLAALMALMSLTVNRVFRKNGGGGWPRRTMVCVTGVGWLAFGGVALIAITAVFSSYIYAMPFHHCPFCILKPEYHYIGYLIFASLFVAVFSGIGTVVAQGFAGRDDLREETTRFISRSAMVALVALTVFVTTVTVPMLVYLFRGGE